MNKENLIKMADYLDNGVVGKFDMRAFCSCVVGHALRHIEGHTGNFNSQLVPGATQRIFGIDDCRTDAKWTFCFGAEWSSDPKMAAARLRYVAQHGDAPSADQRGRFMTAQAPVTDVTEEVYFVRAVFGIASPCEYEEAAC